MKKKTTLQKATFFFLVFFMLCGMFIPTQDGNMVYAAELQSNVITGASITDLSNQPITNPIGAWKPFRIHANYVLPNNKVHTGDTTTLALPVGFAAAQPFTFEVKAGSDLVAKGKIIDGNPVKIVLTYTDYVETHSNVQGSFYFNTQINSNTQPHTGVIPVTLTAQGDNGVVNAGTVTFNPPQVTPVPLIKAGWMDATDKTIGHYKINVNQANKAMVGATLVDTLLNPGVEYVDGSFQVFEGVWISNPTGTDIIFTEVRDITAEFANKISVQGNRFTVAIGSRPAGKGLQFRYKVKINYDPVVGEVFRNEAELEDNGQTHKYATSYKIIDASGVGQGYVYKIRVKKIDETGTGLADAKFDVIRVRNNQKVGTIITGAGGTGELGDLVLDRYKLVETQAPNGYLPLKDPIFVEESDFGGNDHVACKTIKNKPQEKISVSVEKKWVGSVAGPVIAQLKVKGSNIILQEKELNATGNWKHTFTGLDKYAPDGSLIEYRVVEKTVPNGYTVTYEKDSIGTYIIKNTQDKIKVKVTKEWEGITENYPTIKLQLLKNGQAEGAPVELTNGMTTHTWTNLNKADENGINYVYTVKEVDENGNNIQLEGNWYKVTYGGDQQTGLTVTNKKLTPWAPMIPPTRDLKVTKVWKDKDNNDLNAPVEKIEVELYKDGVATGTKLDLTKANNWTGEFKKLPVSATLGGAIHKYTVKEVGESGSAIQFGGKWYKVTYGGTMKDGFTIINEKEDPQTPPTPTPNNKPRVNISKTIPKTGDITNIFLYIGLMLAAGTLLALIVYRSKKQSK